MPVSLAPFQYWVVRGPGTLLMIRLYGGRTMPCIRRIGVRIAGAWPSALIARICTGVIDDSASLPSFIDCVDRA